MRISDLARASSVPIPTIKFYLREGLLHPGRRTAANQATYDDEHLRRLRLVRVLVEVGGLSVSAVRNVLAAIDRDDLPLHEILAVAHTALRGRSPADAVASDARGETDAWLAELGWSPDFESPARDDLAATLAALRSLGWEVGPEVFERYAAHADAIAEAEIERVAALESRVAAVEATVIGTIVFEQAFSALRRLAHERHSRSRFGWDSAALEANPS